MILKNHVLDKLTIFISFVKIDMVVYVRVDILPICDLRDRQIHEGENIRVFKGTY